jgi:pyruvate dehydrogenase E2 component (dihydrolipoamide acetyltransferase)
MSAELTMPKLSDSVADAVILRWLKAPGEGFKRGEALLEVETDKATVVYEAEDDGTLESILVQEGEAAAIGQPIASLGGGGATEAANRSTDAGARPNATPVARRTAVELGVSLHDVAGTGPGGRITSDDDQRAAAASPAATAGTAQGARGDVRVVELTATQATIARRMEQSAAEIPSFTVSADADVTELVALRRGAREESSQAPSLNDFVVKAAALVLGELPRFNASYVDGRIECYSRINVGVAVAVDDALLVRSWPTPTRGRSARLRPRHSGSQPVRATGRSGPRSFVTVRSRSRTSACSACARSLRSSTRRRPRFSPSAACVERPQREHPARSSFAT